MIDIPIAVTSRSLSKSQALRTELLSKFSKVKFNETGRVIRNDELFEFVRGSQALIVGLEPITSDLLKKLPELKFISKYGVGLDNLDLQAMKESGIQLGWTGGVNARSVSELALGFILSLLRGSYRAGLDLAQGQWAQPSGLQLTGKTVGIIGCGFIGKDLTRLLKPFECQILIHDILDISAFCSQLPAKGVSKEELLRSSDVVTLHIPYDKTTHHLIGEPELMSMKPSAVLVNTSRGSIIDEAALYQALRENRIRGAALDVFSIEPPVDSPLFKCPNFQATPHIGGSTQEAVMAMGKAAIENLETLILNS